MTNNPATELSGISPNLHGRRQIFSDFDTVTRENIEEIFTEGMNVFARNRGECKFLWDYYRNQQPVLARTKEVNGHIVNRIVENHAYEIVEFKTGYEFGSPIQYVSKETKGLTDVTLLNRYTEADEKSSKDIELATWMHVCGHGYKIVLPEEEDDTGAPFHTEVLSPISTFVVYRNDLYHTPLLGVALSKKNDQMIASCYAQNHYFELTDGLLTSDRQILLPEVAIIEYPLNPERMGSFERVIPMLDAINNTASDRQDSIDQFVQAFLAFHNMDIDPEEYAQFKADGAIKFRDISPEMKASIDYITAELNQNQTQTYVDHMYETVLRICGVPNRNITKGGTSDNGVAVELRDGYVAAESNAKKTELIFKKSEKRFLRLAFQIVYLTRKIVMNANDVEIRFTRKNYDNILTKSQVLTTMLNNSYIHPRLAFEYCGMFVDPELAYTESIQYHEEHPEDRTGTTETVVNEAEENYAQNNSERLEHIAED